MLWPACLKKNKKKPKTTKILLKASCKHNNTNEEDFEIQLEMSPQKQRCSKKLFSIPEVAEDDCDTGETSQSKKLEEGHGAVSRNTKDIKGRCSASIKVYNQHVRKQYFLSPTKCNVLQKQRAAAYARGMESCSAYEERGCIRSSRQSTRSPDSGLDCGSEEEEARSLNYRIYCNLSPFKGANSNYNSDSSSEGRNTAQASGRKRTLTRQSSVEEDFGDEPLSVAKTVHVADFKTQDVKCRHGKDALLKSYRKDLVSNDARHSASRTESKANQKDLKAANTVAKLANREIEDSPVCDLETHLLYISISNQYICIIFLVSFCGFSFMVNLYLCFS